MGNSLKKFENRWISRYNTIDGSDVINTNNHVSLEGGLMMGACPSIDAVASGRRSIIENFGRTAPAGTLVYEKSKYRCLPKLRGVAMISAKRIVCERNF